MLFTSSFQSLAALGNTLYRYREALPRNHRLVRRPELRRLLQSRHQLGLYHGLRIK